MRTLAIPNLLNRYVHIKAATIIESLTATIPLIARPPGD